MVRILTICVRNGLSISLKDTLLKLSFTHEGVNDFSCVYGFDVSTDEDQESDSGESVVIAEPSEKSSSDSEEMSQEEENTVEPAEELLSFEVNGSNLETLVGMLNPGMTKEQFLMYLVSLEFISFLSINFRNLIEVGDKLGHGLSSI